MMYKGYEGIAEFDEDAHIFSGEVLGLKDVITFQGESVSELEQAFHDAGVPVPLPASATV